jgi:polyhydroxyalkanoate synthesis regulator phasin
MPKKKVTETQAEQSERFRQTVRDLVDAGELNPTEADDAFERLSSKALQPRKPWEPVRP